MIGRLLRIERIKLFTYIPFRISLIIYVVAFALGLVIYPAIDRQIPVISISDVFRFPHVWGFLTWVTEPYNVLLALVIIMITAKEFGDRTFKTQVIFGLSRTDLFRQKVYLIFALSLFATLLMALLSFTLGAIYNEGKTLTMGKVFEDSWRLLAYFLSAFSLMTLGMLVSLLVKNIALSIVTFLALRSFIDPVLWLILRNYEIKWYLPFRSITQLTPIPNIIEIFGQALNESDGNSGDEFGMFPGGIPDWANLLVALAYTLLALYGSYLLLQRRRLT